MGSSKIKKNHKQEEPKKIKKASKQSQEGDQGSPSEKKNTKCQDKEHENVFENNLTEPNEYSKGYQTYRKVHIPDLLNISWNNLSKAKASHLGAVSLR